MMTKDTHMDAPRKKKSLVTRLAVNTLVFVFFSAILSSFLTSYSSNRTFTREEESRMHNLARSTMASLKNTLAADDYASLSGPLEDVLSKNMDVSLLTVEDKKGTLAFVSDRAFLSALRPRDIPLRNAERRNVLALNFTDLQSSQTVKAVQVPVTQGKLYFGKLTLFYYPSSPLEKERQKKFISLGHSIISSVSGLFANFQYFEVAEFAKNIIRGQKDVVYCAVLDQSNLAIFHTNKKLSKRKLTDTSSVRALKAVSFTKPVLVQHVRKNGEDIVDVAMLLGEEEKLGLVRLGYSLTSIHRQEKIERARLFGFALFLSLLGICSAVMLAKRIARPVLLLAKLSEKVGEGDLQVKADVPQTQDEVSFLAESFNHMVAGLREREMIKDVFSRYVTKDVAKKILEKKGEISLGGERRRVTVMFADIRGFTSLSEKLSPEEVVALLNEYFDILVDAVFKHEGTLDKFIGDCIMAVFGAPFYHGDDEERAIQCAIEMQQKMKEYNAERRKQAMKEIEVGIGVNTGFAIAGNIGSKKRIEYTVIGDTVNTASRIQGLAGGGEIIISESAYVEVKDRVEVLSLPPVTVKGKADAVDVFRLMSYIEQKERRRYKRIHTDIPVKYKIVQKDAVLSDALANISGGGCLMHTRAPILVEEVIELEIPLTQQKTLRGIAGKVLDCALEGNGMYRMRVEYTDISQDARDEIVRFVYEALEKGAEEVR